MHPTRNDLSESARSDMVELLNTRLADAIDLRLQAKVAHWNVKGPGFIALHKLFDEVADDVEEYVDLLAERLVQLGGLAEGTARQVARRSTLDEYAAEDSAEGHVPALADALADFGRLAREAIDTAGAEGDQVTSDIFTEIARGTDKWLWMVEAHLQAGHMREEAGRGESSRHASQ
ncbi:MAG TPA: DNA starvation/stationary phase protection protein Dps [Anaeromyxobacteraceae bacterium]|nr:DNA starvation/stationary phase protection protein Dps [Anaeromyxobacteraceae bacterium]